MENLQRLQCTGLHRITKHSGCRVMYELGDASFSVRGRIVRSQSFSHCNSENIWGEKQEPVTKSPLIFDQRGLVWVSWAATLLFRLLFSSPVMESYICPFSHSGQTFLTSKPRRSKHEQPPASGCRQDGGSVTLFILHKVTVAKCVPGETVCVNHFECFSRCLNERLSSWADFVNMTASQLSTTQSRNFV